LASCIGICCMSVTIDAPFLSFSLQAIISPAIPHFNG
jgi:hypothetical protein